VDRVQDHGLDQLGLDQGRIDLENGLAGEDHPPFRYGSHVAGEAQPLEPLQKLAGDRRVSAQVIDGSGVEPEALEALQGLGQASDHQVSAVRRQPPVDQAEGRALVHAQGHVAGSHGQLVKVGGHRDHRRRVAHPLA